MSVFGKPNGIKFNDSSVTLNVMFWGTSGNTERCRTRGVESTPFTFYNREWNSLMALWIIVDEMKLAITITTTIVHKSTAQAVN